MRVGVVSGALFWRAPSSGAHGTSRKACWFPLESTPIPAISPRSLMVSGDVRYRLEPSGTSVFKSAMELFSQITARDWLKSHGAEKPTTSPLAFTESPILQPSPSKVPRSFIVPFFQRAA